MVGDYKMLNWEYFMETKESGIRLLKDGNKTLFRMGPSEIRQDPFLERRVLDGEWDELTFYNRSIVETIREDGVRFQEPQDVFTMVTVSAEGKAELGIQTFRGQFKYADLTPRLFWGEAFYEGDFKGWLELGTNPERVNPHLEIERRTGKILVYPYTFLLDSGVPPRSQEEKMMEAIFGEKHHEPMERKHKTSRFPGVRIDVPNLKVSEYARLTPNNR